MKVCVINYSGNVGKSTICAHLLSPRLRAPVLSVESVNVDAREDGVAVEQVRARDYQYIQEQVVLSDRVVVDVGASNADEFMRRLETSADAHEDYDLFIVPVMRSRKQQADTVNTLQALHEVGIDPHRIRVVFNGMEYDESVADIFPSVYAIGQAGAFVLREDAVVHFNEVFEHIKGTGRTLADVVADTTDYKALLRETTAPDQRVEFARRLAVRRIAVTAAANLDKAFAALVA